MEDFLNALGAALLAWQPVETNLFLIFNFLVGPHRNPAVLSAVFHSVPGITARRKMIGEVMKVELKDKALIKEWSIISKRIEDNSKYRNNLAHFGLVKHLADKETILLLKPSLFNVVIKKERDKDGYDVKKLDEWRMSFMSLSGDMSNFLDRLPNAKRASSK